VAHRIATVIADAEPVPAECELGGLSLHRTFGERRADSVSKMSPRLWGLLGTGGDSRGTEGATDSVENRALATGVARHRSFLFDMDAGSIPAASPIRRFTDDEDRSYQRVPRCQA
jgi:hypothetical protein